MSTGRARELATPANAGGPRVKMHPDFQNCSPNTTVYFSSITKIFYSDFTQSNTYILSEWVNFQSSVILIHSYILPFSGWGFKQFLPHLSLVNNVKSAGQHVTGSCRLKKKYEGL